MPKFEVFLPAGPDRVPRQTTLRVDADNWLAALKAGLSRMGGGQMATNILCDIKDDNSIHVTDPASGMVFRIRELEPDEITEPGAPRPGAWDDSPTVEAGHLKSDTARHDDVTDPGAEAARSGPDLGSPSLHFTASTRIPVEGEAAKPAPIPLTAAVSESPAPKKNPLATARGKTGGEAGKRPSRPLSEPTTEQALPVAADEEGGGEPRTRIERTPARGLAPGKKSPPAAEPPPDPRTVLRPSPKPGGKPTPAPATRSGRSASKPAASRPAVPPGSEVATAPAKPGQRPRDIRRPSSQANLIVEVPEPRKPQPKVIGRKQAPVNVEEVLAELFERVQDVYETRDREEGLAFLLDLAMEKIRCESGSVFVADLGKDDLVFAVARGPKAREIMRGEFTVPMGVGIVGFCAQENVALAVSDAQNDPRFYRRITDAVGYETRSALCAPMALGGRVFGAFEVLNKIDASHFEQDEVAILTYLAHAAAEYLERTEG